MIMINHDDLHSYDHGNYDANDVEHRQGGAMGGAVRQLRRIRSKSADAHLFMSRNGWEEREQGAN